MTSDAATRGVVSALSACTLAVGLTLGMAACTPSRPTAEQAPTSSSPLTTQEPATRLAVAGDTGTGPGTRVEGTVQAMLDQDDRYGYDGLILLGDLIYPDGDAEQAPARISGVFAPLTRRGARLIPVLGNHDYMSGEQAQLLRALDRSTSWYTETVGIVRVIVLDTEQVDSSDQRAWLAQTLAAPTEAPWTIVAMHKPAYSAGQHGSDEAIQDAWVPLFEQYDVPLVLAGHDHDYQRSTPINGVTYVVSGGAANLRPTGHQDFTAVSASIRHFLDLAISTTALHGRAVDQAGNVIDSFEFRR